MVLALILILLLPLHNVASARRAHKRLVIHVPFRMKTHHHIHTVYSHIRSGSSSSASGGHSSSTGTGAGGGGKGGGTKQTIYKIVSIAMQGGGKGYRGYAGHIPHTAHGKSRQGGGGGAHGGTGGGGDALYDEHELAAGLRGPDAHEHGQGDILYDDYHEESVGAGNGHAGRCGRDGGAPLGYKDMIYNHFSRSSDESAEYPEVEEFVDEDEQGFVWE